MTISVSALMEPDGGQLVRTDEQPVTLTFAAATSNSERPFWYEIEIGSDPNSVDIVHTSSRIIPLSATQSGRASQDTPSAGETYTVPETLTADRVYYWHVRATDGANTGPYSETPQFKLFTPITSDTVPDLPCGQRVRR